MKNTALIAPELSRPLTVDKISAGGIYEHIVAAPQELKALSKRFDLLDLPRLEAELNVDHVNSEGVISVSGRLEADVIQKCVVTLEPVQSRVSEKIDVLYAPEELLKKDDHSGDVHSEIGEDDAPEPISNGIIDLGELVSQHLGVFLDPYPRAPGAELDLGGVGDGGANRPFAKLIKLNVKTKK